MNELLGALESTSLALWVGQSLWAYPGLLSVHIVGLAVVVGLCSIRDLRVLGLFSSLNITAFTSLSKLGICGFSLNAVSGFMLFSSQASYFSQSMPFLIKLSCIFVGMVLAIAIQKRIARATAAGTDAAVDTITKTMSFLSLCVWLTAIAAGRLIAYL